MKTTKRKNIIKLNGYSSKTTLQNAFWLVPGPTGLLLFLVMAVTFAGTVYPLYSDTTTSKRILETVEVTNTLVTVRVFHKGNPVESLQKNHFKVFENGKLCPVTTVYLQRKKLKPGEGQAGLDRAAVRLPRLFVLVFNISDYRMNIYPAVRRLFSDIVKVGDRLIIMSNRFYLKDHKVYDPAAEKRRITKIIQIEMKYAKSSVTDIEKTVNSFIEEYNDLISIRNQRRDGDTQSSSSQDTSEGQANEDESDPDGLEQTAVKQFVHKYTGYVREVKNSFLKIPMADYIELAEYLKNQDIEKWVLNFYQIPRFPQPDINSTFQKKIRKYGHSLDLLNALYETEDLPIKAISNAFVNSGATFNTILMKFPGEAFEDLASAMSYKPLSNDSEQILRRISRITGGTVMRTNNLDRFYDAISDKEDISYVLAYNTRSGKEKKRLRVQVWDNTNRSYNVFYDNQKRSRAFRKSEKIILAKKQEESPVIRLNHVIYGGGILRLLVSNYKLNKKNNGAQTLQPGNIRVRLQILNQKSRVVSYKEKNIETDEEQVFVGIKLNELDAGNYDAIVMVEDVNTGEQDLAIQEVVIRKTDSPL